MESPPTKELRIAIPGLVRITSDLAHIGFADTGGCPHNPKPHWLMPHTHQKVNTLADIYHIETGRMLSINDASLEYGGVIANKLRDISPTKNARDAHCHGSHRQGIDIDLNRVDTGGMDMSVDDAGGGPLTLLEFMEHFVVHGFQGSLHYTYRTVVIDEDPVRRLLSIHWRLP